MKKFVKKFVDNKLLLLATPFILMDIIIRIIAIGVNYLNWAMILPSILFNIIWICFFVGIVINLKSIAGRIVYVFFFSAFFLLFVTNSIYYTYTDFFFSFNLLQMAEQASAYMANVLLNTNPVIYLLIILVLITGIVAVIKFPKVQKTNFRNLLFVIGVFVILHSVMPLTMGTMKSDLKWDNWRTPRNVYESFNDANKCMKICGLYEYSFRDFYISFIKADEKDNEEELSFLEQAYNTSTIHEPNEYTGIFEGKNVIFLQLEGIDSWLLNEEDMPNLYGLLEESIVFEQHYSYYNGGGSTFNSELAVNTGFITPISYSQNAYTFSSNYYEKSLPKIMKSMGYRVNAFHMNTGEYYTRELNYLNWGYDNYFGLLDVKNYSDFSYELDRELILNEKFYDEMFLKEEPFMHYIITYTPHTPFNLESKMGKLLGKEIYGDSIPKLGEEESARIFASETDYMVQLLLEALKDNRLYDDTIIVAYADHYLYTLNDKTILDKYKETDSNLINLTPFFVWSSDTNSTVVSKVNSQIDILPTVLNLLGVEYVEEDYIGNDIFDDDFAGYTFFSDYSWFDGNVYVEDYDIKKQVGEQQSDDSYINEKSKLINEIIMKNDLTLKYDYFRRINSE